MCCQRSTNNPMEVRTWDKPYMTCGSWTGSKKTIKHALLLCNGISQTWTEYLIIFIQH